MKAIDSIRYRKAGNHAGGFLNQLRNRLAVVQQIMGTAADVGDGGVAGVDAHVVIERREDVAVVDGAVVGLVAVARGVKRVGND